MTHPAAEQARVGDPWLPDFCRLPRIAAVLAIAELVVAGLALAPHRRRALEPVHEFVAASVFALWLALTIAVLLLQVAPAARRLPIAAGAIAGALRLPPLIALLGAAMVHVLDRNLGYARYPPPCARWQFASAARRSRR